MRRVLFSLFPLLFLACPLNAQDYVAGPEVIGEDAGGETITGHVFHDTEQTGTFDDADDGVEGVLVSNGRDWTRTDEDGAYEIAVRDDMDLTIVQPAGWRTPTDERLVPQFFYVHKRGGTGDDLRFGGLPDTGPAPEQVNFPLTRDGAAGDEFSCAILGDPQVYSGEQIGFLRDGVARDLVEADLGTSDCLIPVGDVVGDDLDLLPRTLEVTGAAGVPQWPVIGNHDIDLDAESNRDKGDTWRRLVGPTYYAFEKGEVLFVALDNVVYPCGEEDIEHGRTHCEGEDPTYNGRVTETQFEWLEGLIERTPEDRLVVLSTHIPLVSYVDATSGKHQTDEVTRLYDMLDGRKALSLSGHTHAIEHHAPGQHFEGWTETTGAGPLPFRHMIVGAASGAWFQGDFTVDGVPQALQRLGAPAGHLRLEFDDTSYTERYKGARLSDERGQWVGVNTPGFRTWFRAIMDWYERDPDEREDVPPRSIHDLPDTRLLTPGDIEDGVWLTANVWAGSDETTVEAELPDGTQLTFDRTQTGEGDTTRRGAEWADPVATARQLSVARYAFESRSGDERAQGYETFRGAQFGPAPPQPQTSIANRSVHLWRGKLPELPVGTHPITVTSTDRNGRTYRDTIVLEVREERPARYWRDELWE
ncbi:MAG: calcineurin-like phosphoesterase C-terminal domain-containing protein [Salinivenus sp.]